MDNAKIAQNVVKDARDSAEAFNDCFQDLKNCRFGDFNSVELFKRWDVAKKCFDESFGLVVDELAASVCKIRKYKMMAGNFKKRCQDFADERERDKVIVSRVCEENRRLQLEAAAVIVAESPDVSPQSPESGIFLLESEGEDEGVFAKEIDCTEVAAQEIVQSQI